MSPTFAALSLSPTLLAVVEELGYATPTPIQTQGIPVLLAGRDLVAQSQTGSGKTAAFALAILQKLSWTTRDLQALVLCPTRELCAQVAREIRKLGRRQPGLQVLIVSGGEPFQPQASALQQGVHIVVATPGRLLDHHRQGTLDLGRVSTVVLDEADRMLDMGFQADLEILLGALPRDRQSAFFSATFPPTIEALSRVYQCDAVRITVEHPHERAPDIRELGLMTLPEEKFSALCWGLANVHHESTLVFCNHKATVRELTGALAAEGVSVDCLHGDLDQLDRSRVIARFRNQSLRVLVATDVAARGLDVEGLDLVVNYDLPAAPEVYIHRIGRTARAGNTGTALSLLTSREQPKIAAIERLTQRTIDILARDGSDTLARDSARAFSKEAPMITLQVSGGRKCKIRPGDLLGALTGEAGGLDAADVGKIEIHDNFSFVAVSKKVAALALSRLNVGRIKGKRFRIFRI